MMGGNWLPYTFGGWMGGIGAFAGFWLFLIIVWSFIWKGWALWLSARNGSKGWFIALLIINTLGILEILYIFVFSKGRAAAKSSRSRSRR